MLLWNGSLLNIRRVGMKLHWNGSLQQMVKFWKLNGVNLLRNSFFFDRKKNNRKKSVSGKINGTLWSSCPWCIIITKWWTSCVIKKQLFFFSKFLQRSKMCKMHENDNFRDKCRLNFEHVSNLIYIIQCAMYVRSEINYTCGIWWPPFITGPCIWWWSCGWYGMSMLLFWALSMCWKCWCWW